MLQTQLLDNQWFVGIVTGIAGTALIAIAAAVWKWASRLPYPNCKPYVTREQAHKRAAELIRAAIAEPIAGEIDLVSIRSATDRKVHDDPTYAEYRKALAEALDSKTWMVRRFFYIDSEAALDDILRNDVAQFPRATRYSIKATAAANFPRALEPFIIGTEAALIGVTRQDKHTDSCIEVRGKTSVNLLHQHFQALWSDADALWLRQTHGPDEEGIAELRMRLRSGA